MVFNQVVMGGGGSVETVTGTIHYSVSGWGSATIYVSYLQNNQSKCDSFLFSSGTQEQTIVVDKNTFMTIGCVESPLSAPSDDNLETIFFPTTNAKAIIVKVLGSFSYES